MHFSSIRLISTALVLCGLFFTNNVLGRSQVDTAASAPERAEVTTVSKNIPVQRDLSANGKEGNASAYDYTIAVVCIAMLAIFGYGYFARVKSGKFSFEGLRSARLRNDSELKLKRQLPLTAKHSLHLVVWNEQEFLLACGDHGVTLISRRNAGRENRDEMEPALIDSVEKFEELI